MTLAKLGARLGDLVAAAKREPVEITSVEGDRRAVIVSPAFFDEAVQAIEDLDDIRAAAAARREEGFVAHEDLAGEIAPL